MGTRKKKAAGQTEPWPGVRGGFIRWDSNGVGTYWIARRYQGKRWCFSLRVDTPDAALERLRQWERDPYGFRVDGEGDQSLRLTDELRDEYLAWSKARRNSESWLVKQARLLRDWQEDLGTKDMKRLDLAKDVLAPLDKRKGRNHRIAVLKTLFSWLRKERHLIRPDQDPTLDRLSVHPPKAAQLDKVKAFTRKTYLAVLAKLETEPYRSAARVQAATGWHISEVQRFAKGGSIEALPSSVENPEGHVVLCCPSSKGGEPLKTRVSPEVAQAGQVLLDKGSLDYSTYREVLMAGCEAAGLERTAVQPGSFRHSVATWAVEQGAPLPEVSTFLNHKSFQTTKKFYSLFAVPKKVPTLG